LVDIGSREEEEEEDVRMGVWEMGCEDVK